MKKTRKPAAAAAKRRRHNPDSQAEAIQAAAEMNEAFHGRPANKVVTVEQDEYDRPVLSDLGRLRELAVRIGTHAARRYAGAKTVLPFYGTTTRVTCDPGGTNLYFVGGDQTLDLASVGLEDTGKDVVVIGTCTDIVYSTRKGFHGFEKVDYTHRFGEDGGTPPTLAYSTLNRRFILQGGSYTVRPEGIVN